MDQLKTFLLGRLKEKSTWAAILTVIATAVGIQVAPEQQGEIATGAAALLAVILAAVNTSGGAPAAKKPGDAPGQTS
ncbi:MAG: hypothetical protein SFV21_00200 [Rhodospirillaceae bacterium]|nr:hypothetical protein [Rhodospirillaceae bacterium]